MLNNQAVAICSLQGEPGTWAIEAAQGLPEDCTACGDMPLGQDALQQAVASRRNLTWDQVTAELETAQKELRRVYGEIGGDDLVNDSRFREWTEILVRHYEYHLVQIEQLV